MKNKKIKLGMIFLAVVLLISLVSATYSRSNPNYGLFDSYVDSSSEVDEGVCEAGQDFIVQITPFGCTPAVVRTDLLEEQNVPIFCQLGATQINPLIDVQAIESISFVGEYPDEVSGIGFHPANAALGISEDLNSPVLNNIGYVVIILKEQSNSSGLPDFVEGNLTAKIKYDIKNAFGIGQVSFYLPEMTDDEWDDNYKRYSFWDGRGYLRAESIDDEGATISIYDDLKKISSVSLKEGETSEKIAIPGFDCSANLEIKLNDLENPDTMARLRVDGDVLEIKDEGYFLDNKCQVKDLEKQGLIQKVSIKCSGDEGSESFNLRIEPKVKLNIDGNEGEYKVGDWLYDTEDSKAVYLGYVGTYDSTGEQKDLYAYFIKTKKKEELSEKDISDVASIAKSFTHERLTGIAAIDILNTIGKSFAGSFTLIQKFIAEGIEVNYIPYNYISDSGNIEEFPSQDLFGREVKIEGYAGAQNVELDGESEDYYDKAIGDYETIVESFSSEKYSDDLTYGKEALSKEIILASDAGQKQDVAVLCDEFEQKYSAVSAELKIYCDESQISNSAVAGKIIMINGKSRKISFAGIYEPSLDEFSVDIFFEGNGTNYSGSKVLQKNEPLSLSENEYIFLKELGDDYAEFDVRNVEGLSQQLISSNLKIALSDYEIFGENNYKIRVDKINLKKTAKVSVIPNIDNVGTDANFSFKIGIEKRAITLSPEKTKELIENLNETIERWTKISEGLGKAVKGMKTACLAVGAGLTIKNFFANVGGKSIARQEVMRGDEGWYERCAELVADGTYTSQDQCLIKESDNIDNDVDLFYDVIQEQNDKIEELQDGITEKKFLSESVVDEEKFMERYSPQVQSYLGDNLGESVEDPSGVGESVDVEEVLSSLSYEGWQNNNYDKEQLKDIELYAMVLEKDPDNEIAKQGLYSGLLEIQTNSNNYVERQSFADKYGVDEVHYGSLEELNELQITQDLTYGDLTGLSGADISSDSFVQLYKDRQTNQEYLFVLDDDYVVEQTYIIENGYLSVASESSQNPLSIGFKKYDRTTYENHYDNPELRYYETEPYDGLPAIVPFDLDGGWYAATKQTLSTSGGIAAYDESGRVTSYYLCNVGANGLEEFNSGIGDDICQMINTGTGQAYNQFAGLDESEATERIVAGIEAIEQASKQYNSGVTSVTINVGYGSITLDVGSPAVDVPETQCQDFMSPKECQLLFNVCDPVICPSSRCDFGGTYPVQDVIQSGIIGSLVLCLPNVREGIYVPVCLTGVKAGIDGLLSVYTSYRDCLQESLDSGKMVGICDEIYSIYMCEFLWRQALPLAKIAIPKMMEFMLGQNVRGGGEYLGVESAWSNAEDSLNYFTQYYAANSYEAFKARTAEEVGGEICKSYISGVYPDGGNLLDSLTEPDSPSQFHGRFDEIPFTSATVPPTSQYKVFYHIYAGEDSGVYYKVYLKGNSESSFYQDVSSSRSVASGYIEAGGYASETVDFTAPSGYQEMCIMVNNQEECGFQEVSTSFAIDYITEEYASSQASETDITSEDECISGSASAYSLLNPNLQEGVDEVLNPEIYNQGIIRICATDNPGQGTDPYAGGEGARWIEVGYCDDEKIKCWLDTQSVEDVIENSDVEEDVLNEVTENQLDILRNKEGYLSSDEVDVLVGEVEDLIESGEFEEAIDTVGEYFDSVFLNDEKANLLLLRGNAYGELLNSIFVVEPEETEIVEDTTTTETVETQEENNINETEEVNEEEEVSDTAASPGYKIWELAKQYEEAEYNQVRSDGSLDNVCASFVTFVLNTAGANIECKGEFIPDLITEFQSRDDFIEIYNDELEKGDIVILYNRWDTGGKNTRHITIFSEYKDDDKVYVYDDPGGNVFSNQPVRLKDFDIDGFTWKIYRSFRYVGDDYEAPSRIKWTIDSAILEVNSILQDDDYDGSDTTYSTAEEIKKFVNELCDDDILSEEECEFNGGSKGVKEAFRTRFRDDEKTMEDLKKILQVEFVSGGAH